MSRGDKIKGMVGLAVKAGKAVSGSFAVEGAVRRGRARLVLVDGRASANRLRETESMCAHHGVECVRLEDSGMLEDLLGRENRTVMAILDEGFAVAIREILKKE
jgi:ribosomal protein L7Ae-like RNA K-turn-binding protein